MYIAVNENPKAVIHEEGQGTLSYLTHNDFSFFSKISVNMWLTMLGLSLDFSQCINGSIILVTAARVMGSASDKEQASAK